MRAWSPYTSVYIHIPSYTPLSLSLVIELCAGHSGYAGINARKYLKIIPNVKQLHDCACRPRSPVAHDFLRHQAPRYHGVEWYPCPRHQAEAHVSDCFEQVQKHLVLTIPCPCRDMPKSCGIHRFTSTHLLSILFNLSLAKAALCF